MPPLRLETRILPLVTRHPFVIARGGSSQYRTVQVTLRDGLHARDGIEGVITGRALYDGRLDLAAALSVARAA